MQNELCTLIATALQDGTHGVAQQLTTLPIFGGDARPVNVLVVDGTRDDNAVQGEQLPETTAVIMILVTPDGPTRYKAANVHGQGSVAETPVALTVFHNGARQPAEKVRDVGYVLRAIIISLNQWYEFGGNTRKANEVNVTKLTGVSTGLIQHDGLGGLGAVVFTIEALDKRAQRLF